MASPSLWSRGVICVVVYAILAICTLPAAAQADVFAQHNFRVVGSYLEGEITNTSGSVQRDVRVTISALSDKGLTAYWTHTENIGDIDSGERVTVRVRYRDGLPKPDRLRFNYETGDTQSSQPAQKRLFSFSSEGHGYTEWFTLPEGEISFDYSYKAAQNGTVQMVVEDKSGSPALIVLDEAMEQNATHTGSKTMSVPESGQYRLNILSQGAWSLNIFQGSPPQKDGADGSKDNDRKQAEPDPITIREDESGVFIITR